MAGAREDCLKATRAESDENNQPKLPTQHFWLYSRDSEGRKLRD